MRIDKYLKVSRLVKRRETARALCDAGLVKVGGKPVKPSFTLREGDIIAIEMGRRFIKVEVKDLRPFAGKAEAEGMYEIIEDAELRKEA